MKKQFLLIMLIFSLYGCTALCEAYLKPSSGGVSTSSYPSPSYPPSYPSPPIEVYSSRASRHEHHREEPTPPPRVAKPSPPPAAIVQSESKAKSEAERRSHSEHK